MSNSTIDSIDTIYTIDEKIDIRNSFAVSFQIAEGCGLESID